jgi:hypothetical protein
MTNGTCDQSEGRCTLPDQKVERHGIETLPDGERARYLDYNHPHFPSHWGEEEQGMKTPATPSSSKPITGHCTGVVHTPTGVVSSHASAKPASQAATVVKATATPAYPC